MTKIWAGQRIQDKLFITLELPLKSQNYKTFGCFPKSQYKEDQTTHVFGGKRDRL